MAFEKGDIVLIDPDADINKGHLTVRMRRCMNDAIELEVVKVYVEAGTVYTRCTCDIDGVKNEMTLYRDRLMLAKRDIVENCFVRCLDPRRSSILVKDTVYRVMSLIEKDGAKLVRVATNKREIRHAFPIEMFTFRSKAMPEGWDKIVVENWEEKILNKLAEGKHTGVCSFAIINENGNEDYQRGGPCHAAFGYQNNNAIKAVALCFSRFYNEMNEVKKEGYKRFLNYLVNESPLKDCFIPRTPEDMVKNGVMMNIVKSVDEITVAAVATRHYTEYVKAGDVFDEIMDLGFDGNVAMFVSTFFTKREDGFIYNNWAGGHHFLNAQMDYKELFQFFKGGFIKENLPAPYKPMAAGRTPYRIQKTVAAQRVDKHWNPLPGSVSDYVKGLKGIQAMPAGPFGGAGFVGMSGKNSLIRLCAAVSKEL